VKTVAGGVKHRDVVTPLADLTRPVPIAAALVVAVNDHLLKGAGLVPAAITGKASDVAGMVLAGVLAVAVVRAAATAMTGRTPRRTGGLGVAALIAVGAFFAALKLMPVWNHALTSVWGVNTLDAGDLWALPMLALTYVWLRDRDDARERHAAPPRFVTCAALSVALLVCAATPAPPPVPPPPRPGWVLAGPPLALPCGEATAWIAKTGKTGTGLTVRVVAPPDAPPCEVIVASAVLRFADGEVRGQEVPLSGDAPPPPPDRDAPRPSSAATYHYLGFVFDNEARWNRHQRSAEVAIELEVAGARVPWQLSAQQQFIEYPAVRR